VTSNYGYDAIYELTSVLQGANTTESYTYDLVGNRLSSLSVSPYSYNASNELTSTPNATYGYDLNGNAVTKNDSTGITTYAWDFENRLTGVTLPAGGGTVTFAYDPFGRRIEKASSAGTSIYAYDGDNLVEETNSSGAVVARYSQGLNIDEPLAMLRSGATDFYEADGLGSVTSLTSAAGALAQTYTFDSFGKQTASSGSLTNPFQYTGREFDPETGLYYYRARYYDPSIGRFWSEDPLGVAEGQDFYAYANNDVTGFRDPLGLAPQSPHFANTVGSCDQKFRECKKKAGWDALKGGLPVLFASNFIFDFAETFGCADLTGPAFAECFLLIHQVQEGITPILLAPFGGNYFDNLADCWKQRAKCLAQMCKQ
jgi:RHS repeat-associated protein